MVGDAAVPSGEEFELALAERPLRSAKCSALARTFAAASTPRRHSAAGLRLRAVGSDLGSKTDGGMADVNWTVDHGGVIAAIATALLRGDTTLGDRIVILSGETALGEGIALLCGKTALGEGTIKLLVCAPKATKRRKGGSTA